MRQWPCTAGRRLLQISSDARRRHFSAGARLHGIAALCCAHQLTACEQKVEQRWFRFYEQMLQGKLYFVGPHLTHADISVFDAVDVIVRYTPFGKASLKKFRNLSRFYTNVLNESGELAMRRGCGAVAAT